MKKQQLSINENIIGKIMRERPTRYGFGLLLLAAILGILAWNIYVNHLAVTPKRSGPGVKITIDGTTFFVTDKKFLDIMRETSFYSNEQMSQLKRTVARKQSTMAAAICGSLIAGAVGLRLLTWRRESEQAMNENQRANQAMIKYGIMKDTASPVNSLYGVNGWLLLFVVSQMYIAPVSFVLRTIMAWGGVTMITKEYPGFIVLFLIDTVVSGFLTFKWIKIARRLRDIKPGIVQETKTWLKIGLVYIICGAPTYCYYWAGSGGCPYEGLVSGYLRSFLAGVIGFAIWYPYFNVSKRIKATYPDWNKSR